MEKHNRNARNWRRAHPEKHAASKRKSTYGITQERFEELLIEQNGLCAVCRRNRATDVDHNHETKEVRSLLCGDCNRALGLFRESVDTLVNAVMYLRKWNVT